MEDLIQHLWLNNREEIVSNSIKNCHVGGLDSIMLLKSPGKSIRLYVAKEGSELHNEFFILSNLPLAFHPHHCNLTIKVIKGELTNIEIAEHAREKSILFNKYEFSSEISGNGLGFKQAGQTYFSGIRTNIMREGDVEFMRANQIHTVFIDKHRQEEGDADVAWLVFEGMEDKDYKSVCYSKAKDLHLLKKQEWMYNKMEDEEVESILENLNLINPKIEIY